MEGNVSSSPLPDLVLSQMNPTQNTQNLLWQIPKLCLHFISKLYHVQAYKCTSNRHNQITSGTRPVPSPIVYWNIFGHQSNDQSVRRKTHLRGLECLEVYHHASYTCLWSEAYIQNALLCSTCWGNFGFHWFWSKIYFYPSHKRNVTPLKTGTAHYIRVKTFSWYITQNRACFD